MKKYFPNHNIGRVVLLALSAFKACGAAGSYTQEDTFYALYCVVGNKTEKMQTQPKHLVYVHEDCTPNQLKGFLSLRGRHILLFQRRTKSFFKRYKKDEASNEVAHPRPLEIDGDKSIKGVFSKSKEGKSTLAGEKELLSEDVFTPKGRIAFKKLPTKNKSVFSFSSNARHQSFFSIDEEPRYTVCSPLSGPHTPAENLPKGNLGTKPLSPIKERRRTWSGSNSPHGPPAPKKEKKVLPQSNRHASPHVVVSILLLVVIYGALRPTEQQEPRKKEPRP